MTFSAGDPAPPRRGTKLFASAMIVSQVCALGRYAVLARILGPEQLGLAATLILTAQFFDAVTDSGSDRFLIQDPSGGDPRAQSLVHLVAIGRGAGVALALILLARPVADFFREPVLAGGLAALALMPLVGGAIHYDFRRRQREHDFRGEGATVMAAELVSLVTTTAAALIVGDFTAVIYGLVARSAAMVLMSHASAAEPYRVALAREHVPALWRFGAPLLANGLLLFAGLQSDRLLIGRLSGLFELGQYSTILLPILYPCAMLMRFLGGVYLPRLAAHRSTRWEAERELDGLVLLSASVMATGFALIGPAIIPLIFGPAFGGGVALTALVGIHQSARLMRTVPTTSALGLGASRIVLTANIVRLVAIPLAVATFLLWPSTVAIVAAFAVGELVALGIGRLLVNRRLARSARTGIHRDLAFLALGLLLTTGGISWDQGAHVRVAFAVVAVAILLLAIAARDGRRVLKSLCARTAL